MLISSISGSGAYMCVCTSVGVYMCACVCVRLNLYLFWEMNEFFAPTDKKETIYTYYFTQMYDGIIDIK